MPTVWVTQETPKHDYSSASEYGTLRFVTAKDFVGPENHAYNQKLVSEIWEALDDFNFDEDFLVPSGSPIVQMAVMAILGSNSNFTDDGVGHFKILKWSSKFSRYSPIELEI